MTEKTNKSVFERVLDIKSASGQITKQVIVNCSPYDTSTMNGYKEGDRVYTGFTTQLRVIKFGSNPKNTFINIDPSDNEVRKAISEMYKAFDETLKA